MDALPQTREDDTREVWAYGMNVHIDRDHDELPAPLSEEQRAARQRQVNLYAKLVLVKLDADLSRLAEAARQCREIAAHAVAQGDDPHSDYAGGYACGAELADTAIAMIRRAHADVRPAARQRLLRRAQRDTAGFSEPSMATRARRWLQTSLHNTRWLRKPRRLRSSWRRRRDELAGVQIRYREPATVADYGQVEAHLHDKVIGRAGYQACPQCRRGLLCKVNAYAPYEGVGLGTLLVSACLTAGGLPTDGYTWYTTAQYDEARGFWRAMGRTHRTPFTAPLQPQCPHMRRPASSLSDLDIV
ncbi:hypothetical protein [Krasilnikovia sp. MM14-A1259]|uniref:hypothetical protein n=1 Tax=Krasilnikovia sp. MM14-A1259 TaxID=3373539 RepID=UPI00399C7A13